MNLCSNALSSSREKKGFQKTLPETTTMMIMHALQNMPVTGVRKCMYVCELASHADTERSCGLREDIRYWVLYLFINEVTVKNWQSPVSLNGNSSSSLHCIYSRHSCLHQYSHCQHYLPLLRQPALCYSLIGWGLIWVALWVHCSAQCTWKRFNYF